MSIGEVMARPRGRPAKQEDEKAERVSIINLKGSRAFDAWLEQVHRKTNIPKARIIRLALAEWSRLNKHPEPPEI